MRPLSEATSRIAAKNFSQKYVVLGRIVERWEQIIGYKFANRAQPLKINYRKSVKNKKPTATLDIATSSSYATVLLYQKDLILERINQLFGEQWVTDIRFVVSEFSSVDVKEKKTIPPLTQSEKKYLSDVLSSIDNPELRERLEKFGKAVLIDSRTNKGDK